MRSNTFVDEMASRAAKGVEVFPRQRSLCGRWCGLPGQDAHHRGKLGDFLCPAQAWVLAAAHTSAQDNGQQKRNELLETPATAGHAATHMEETRNLSLCEVRQS